MDTKTTAGSTDGYETRIRLHAGTPAIVANYFLALRRSWRNRSISMIHIGYRSYLLSCSG
jgi:hypothetical protein